MIPCFYVIMRAHCLQIFITTLVCYLPTAATAPTSSVFSSSGPTPTPTSTSTPDFVGFVGDPNGRGTVSLVISCLLTLLLCVWSALHLNVPRYDEPLLSHFWVNIRWIITGVYAPELVVFTAWRQWSSAKILGGLVRESNGSGKLTMRETRELADRWTMTHGFFASTGGFAFEIRNNNVKLDSCFLPSCGNDPARLTLTARGMALLVRCGRLPDMSKADIADKSKANDIAKALVIIQASWMLVQVIGRLIARLPVTLLEVNTIAHVLCAFLMYAMWWNKPLAPKEPFVLRGDWIAPLCAYMYMSSEMSGEASHKAIKSQTLVKTLFASLHLYSRVPEIESVAYCYPVRIEECHNSEEPIDSPTLTVADSVLHNGTRIRDTEVQSSSTPGSMSAQGLVPAIDRCLNELQSKKLEKAVGTAFFERRPRVKAATFRVDDSSLERLTRWRLAASAIATYPAIQEHYLLHSHNKDRCLHFKSEELLVQRVQNWPWDDLLRDVGGLVVGMILWLACFTYGAIHAAAWSNHFPTTAEQWLWRSSSLYIGFCGGLWIVLNYIAQAYKPLNSFWEGWMDGGGEWWQNLIISIPVVLCGSSLVFARAFIVIEAFVSIRELPAGAYDTPTWTQVFPHF